MAYSDPQTITVDTNTISLPRAGTSLTEGRFLSNDRKYVLRVQQNVGKRTRHVARLEFADIVSNPLVPNQSMPVSSAATFTVDAPNTGLSSEDIVELASALATWLSTENLTKLVGGEN